MIRKNRPRASSLFLMELILAILFFSIASAVCVQFFVKSHLLSRDADALNHAVNECSNIAEILNTTDSISEGVSLLKQLYPDAAYPDAARPDAIEPGSNAPGRQAGTNAAKTDTATKSADISFYYDDEFLPCSPKNPDYILSLHMEQSGQMLSAGMKFCTSDKDAVTLYQLNTEQHIARRTGYEKR